MLAHGQSVYQLWRANAAPQSTDQSERISFVIGNYLRLDTLQAASQETDFTSIALAGEAVGGPSSLALSPTQYVVTSGETLSSIATKAHLHIGSIILANSDLKTTDLLHVGQVITIPTKDASDADLETEWANRQKQTQTTAKIQQASTSTKNVKSTAVSSNSLSAQGFIDPMKYGYVSQGFNFVVHPGEDLTAKPGTPIVAISDGTIITEAKGWNGGYGNFLMLDAGDGYTARYAHLTGFVSSLPAGSYVTKGEVIGYSGNTGNSTGPHLHFEIRYKGTPINPGI